MNRFSSPVLHKLSLILLFTVSNLISNAQNYWQQEVNYKIQVRLNDQKHELYGEETVEYINHSPDELSFIYFHLWPNAYENNRTALAKQKLQNNPDNELFKNPANRGFMDSLAFRVNGVPVTCEPHPEHNDICKLILNSPLHAGERITITTPFRVKIPAGGISRMGHIGQSYQITQWYPKPAVYDKKGWHPIPYLDMGEFYSEFGSFDVSITLPKNYIVGATGELQTASEIKWMSELAEKGARQDSFSKRTPLIRSDSVFKTIRYTEKNVHDFAWFADKGFHVLKGSVILPHSGDMVTTWSLFPDRVGKFWKKSPGYIHDAVYYYSLWLGNYPYKNCTALEGPLGAGGGMEYPGITIVSAGSTDVSLDEVITHEVGHNWLYGILGFNERDYPYMDEGINTHYEMRYMEAKYPFLKLNTALGIPDVIGRFLEMDHLTGRQYYELMYLLPATYRTDQPLTLKSTDFSYINYGAIVYMKTGMCFTYLRNYLGTAEFDRIMQKFFQTWKFKHPQPEDLRKAFEEGASKNVVWFFDDLLPSDKKIDYKLSRIRQNEVLVKNKGQLPTPLILGGMKNDSLIYEQWFDGFTGKKWLSLPDLKADKLVLDENHVTPELYRHNNYLRTHGICKKVEPLKFKLFATLDDYKYTAIQYFPVVGWNSSNKIMAGGLFHNGFLLKKPFEYQLMPMYGFYGSKLAGMGKVSYNFFPQFANIRVLSFSLSGMQFAFDKNRDFNKLKAEAKVVFRNRDFRFFPRHTVSVTISQLTNLINRPTLSNTRLLNLNYQFQNPAKLNLTRVNYNFKANKDFGRTSVEVIYNVKPRFFRSPLSLRLFTGYMFYYSANFPVSAFYVSGRTGVEDFEYEGLFPGRFDTDGQWTHQFMPCEGGFGIPYRVVSNKVMASLGFEFKPLSKGYLNFVKIYGNVGRVKNEAPLVSPDHLMYEAGVKLGQAELLEIYIPVFYKKEDFPGISYRNLVRFNLNLKVMNPFNILERMPNL